ncbi:unnamed protein product [Rhodiola kirilowii]
MTHFSNFSLIYILSFLLATALLLHPALSATAKCNLEDRKVLFQIKTALNNPYHLASWRTDLDCCSWYCVDCDPITHRITALTIFSGNISGQIPPQVGNLPYLETLIFRHLTNVTGTIPSTISNLKHLKMVRLSYTNLSGTIPEFFSTLSNLTYLDLSFNDLTGPLPKSINKLTNLGALHFDRNKLTGSIPESYGHFTGTIPDLYLSHNNLSGKIPASLGQGGFSLIDLSRNKLEGDATSLLGKNNSVYSLDISRNLFMFDFGKVEFPAGLSYLDINHNKIYGNIPKAMTELSELNFFNASYNRLCGAIPIGGKLQSFDNTTYFHNRCLCGSPLPECK